MKFSRIIQFVAILALVSAIQCQPAKTDKRFIGWINDNVTYL